MNIGIKYCGGCNPRYDRVKAVKELEESYKNDHFGTAIPGNCYDAVIVVCGCQAACAKYDGIESKRFFVVSRQSDINDHLCHLSPDHPVSL